MVEKEKPKVPLHVLKQGTSPVVAPHRSLLPLPAVGQLPPFRPLSTTPDQCQNRPPLTHHNRYCETLDITYTLLLLLL
ncbi:hypothetical protein LZ30DRAFT_717260 [Colletotrichum cereale]|nr:hypothetical protein LZ30DRAFT_717260 [Colletotrichum cereale]